MNIELTATPLQLMAIALDTKGVLISLGLTTLFIFGYILLRKQSSQKDNGRGRMLHKTGMNKVVATATAIAVALIVMSWTTSYNNAPIAEDNITSWEGEYPDEVQIIELEKDKTPPTVEPPKMITDLFKIEEKKEIKKEPITEPITGTKDGTGKEVIKIPGPIGPPKIVIPPLKPKEEVKVDKGVKVYVEKMPRFCGCEDKKGDEEAKKICADNLMKRYLSKVVDYPAMAVETGCEGKVFMRFVVEPDGSISNIEIAKDATPGCGLADAAKKAVVRMGQEKCFVPGQQGLDKVRVRMIIPVVFKLND